MIGNGVGGSYNGLSATAFFDVPVVGGNVTGFFGANGGISVLSGLTVVTVPEPGAVALIGLASFGLMLRRRRAA